MVSLSAVLSSALMLGSLAASASAADFTVTNTNADGTGSVAQAIIDANEAPGSDRVLFAIPGPGVHRIDLSAVTVVNALPIVTDTLMIDGYSQPGAAPNSLTVGDNAVILIHLDGGSAVGDCLSLLAPGCEVRGLCITGFRAGIAHPLRPGNVGGTAIGVAANNCTIAGNFIGVLPDGETAAPNVSGVGIGRDGGRVGGVIAADRNVISGNLAVAVSAANSSVTVTGNYIGTDARGTTALPNATGVLLFGEGQTATRIGGTAPGDGNLISGNDTAIRLGGTSTFIGPPRPFPSSRAQIQGNAIGVRSDRQTPLGNGTGIEIVYGSENLIGGLEPGAGNVIAFNRGPGIRISEGSGDSLNHRNTILSNAIYGNAGLAIDLGGDGPTPNDPLDVDTGPNAQQNFPTIKSATITGSTLRLDGILDSTPNETFQIQLFANSQDPARPAQDYLGTTSVVSDSNGQAAFSATFPLAHPDVTFDATATNAGGDTSEFPTLGALKNISTRADVQTGDHVMIAGFILSTGRTIAVRGIGPSLDAISTEQRLSDPVLQLFDSGGVLVATNDNWADDANGAARLQALGLAPSAAAESALVEFLPGGAYTAVLSGRNGGRGIGLVEAYDVTPAGAGEALNLSTRGLVANSDQVLIGGCLINEPAGHTRVVIRAIGPSLARAGVANPLTDPTVELHDSQGAVLASNDNWGDTQRDPLVATGLAPSDNLESAILTSLATGAYTAIVRSKDAVAGVGLVEIYNLH